MRSLARALSRAPDPLPWPWGLPVEPQPGYLMILLGGPGAGKSTFALDWAVRLASAGRPVLMGSWDTDLPSQALRATSMLNYGVSVNDVKRDPERWSKWLHDQLIPIRWCDTPMQASDIEGLLQAETEFLGEPPALTVIDVMGNLIEREPGYEPFIAGFAALHRAARKAKTVILALHHVKRGQAANGVSRVKKADGVYGGEQQAEVVLGLWRADPKTMRLALLKNRMGPDDAEGNLTDDIVIDLSQASLRRKFG